MPLRFNWILRNEPTSETPPLRNSACVIEDRLLSVYEPGYLTSPTTKTEPRGWD